MMHIRRADTIIEDYDKYANLVIHKALYHAHNGDVSKALEELNKLSTLFDERDFVNIYYCIIESTISTRRIR